MTFWNCEQRRQALEFPPQLVNQRRAQEAWTKQRRSELGFCENPFKDGLWFHASKAGKSGYHWLLIDQAKAGPQQEELLDNRSADETEMERLQWDVAFHGAGLVAEGPAGTVEGAWAAACQAAGTDRLEIGQAGTVTWLKKARTRLQKQERLASLNPTEADAQPQRFVYAETRRSDDDYGISRELQEHRRRYCFRRFKLVKETAKFYFCDLENYEVIDRNGEAAPDEQVFRNWRRDTSLTRVRKDLWDEPEVLGGRVQDSDSRYISNAPWGVGWIWLDLDTMVAEVDRKRAEFAAFIDENTEGDSWTKVLAIPADEQSSLTTRDLQRYFRKAALRTHPDQGGTAEAFQAVQQAFEVGQRMLQYA